MARVTPPDLEKWLVDYLRAELTAGGRIVRVTNKEPPATGPTALKIPLEKPVVIIRDDSGNRLDWTTFDRSVGISVLAGDSRQDDKPANDLARTVMAILADDALAEADGSPIAFVNFDGCNGPYPVTETLDCARRYLTVQYTVVGQS